MTEDPWPLIVPLAHMLQTSLLPGITMQIVALIFME